MTGASTHYGAVNDNVILNTRSQNSNGGGGGGGEYPYNLKVLVIVTEIKCFTITLLFTFIKQ